MYLRWFELNGTDRAPQNGDKIVAPKYKLCEHSHLTDPRHYIVVRKDLTTGQIGAMICHATGESVTCRVASNTAAVILTAKDEDHIVDLDARLSLANIPHVLIRECDGSAMAIGLEPTLERKPVDKILGNLPLLK